MTYQEFSLLRGSGLKLQNYGGMNQDDCSPSYEGVD